MVRLNPSDRKNKSVKQMKEMLKRHNKEKQDGQTKGIGKPPTKP